MATEYINGYAIALLEISNEKNKVKKFKSDLLVVLKVLEENFSTIGLLNCNKNDCNKTLQVIRKTFEGLNNPEIVNWLCILAEKSKMALSVKIINKYIKFVNMQLKVKNGIVYSSEWLDIKQIKKLEEKIGKQIKATVELRNKLDVKLISGISIEVDGKQFDYSIASKLEALRNEMLGRGK